MLRQQPKKLNQKSKPLTKSIKSIKPTKSKSLHNSKRSLSTTTSSTTDQSPTTTTDSTTTTTTNSTTDSTSTTPNVTPPPKVKLPSNYRSIPMNKSYDMNNDSTYESKPSSWPLEQTTLSIPKISKLRNGIRIITQSSNVPISHMAVSIDMGSRHEIAANGETGLSHFLERAILRSTTNRETTSLIRDIAQYGADIGTSGGRENLMITATTPTKINPIFNAIADLLKHAAYDEKEVNSDIQHYLNDMMLRNDNTDIYLNEVLHQTAFGNHGLGQTLYMDEEAISQLTPQKLKSWHDKFIVGERITIGATGVDHDTFVSLADELLGSLPSQSSSIILDPPTKFIGGDIRLNRPDYEGVTQLALAWEGPSIKSDHVVEANVIQALLGGGSSFSSGGPGKGLYTRLYQRLVCQRHDVTSAESFLTSYSDSGIFGVYMQVDPMGVLGATETALTTIVNLPDTMTDSEVQRAKNMLKSNLLNHIGNSSHRAEEMARNIQLFNEFKFPKFMDLIDTVTTTQVRDVAAELFREKPITVVTLGDASQLPQEIVFEPY